MGELGRYDKLRLKLSVIFGEKAIYSMVKFKTYALLQEVKEKVNYIASVYMENQGNQALTTAQQNLMQTFQQEYQKDANGALTWLNQLYTSVLPAEYKKQYGVWQQSQGQNQQQPQQQQPQQQQK